MATLLLNVMLGSWVVLFAAMALFPLFMDRSSRSAKPQAEREDQVVRLEHRAVIERRRGSTPSPLASVDPINDHPSHRSAA
ncbi:MAG: hypothetical protein WKF81_01635 [Thermomicrobiales bacterium]